MQLKIKQAKRMQNEMNESIEKKPTVDLTNVEINEKVIVQRI
jgi:hypothetical protein